MTELIQDIIFDRRFLESHAGSKILTDHITALIELVANAWDAGATSVEITWPSEIGEPFSIKDNGTGMTDEEFTTRWYTLAYNRVKDQGPKVVFPAGASSTSTRTAFGRNGVGRFAGFCFDGKSYSVTTLKEGQSSRFRVTRGQEKPLSLNKMRMSSEEGHGTTISVEHCTTSPLTAVSVIKNEIGIRFLTDPDFKIFINQEEVDLLDIDERFVNEYWLDVPGQDLKIKLIVLKTHDSDRTMKQHGVAWHVNGRLVGECTWQDSEHKKIVDGRRSEAKRYSIIVFADCLADAVAKDWSSFDTSKPIYKEIAPIINDRITEILLENTKEKRRQTFETVKTENKSLVSTLPSRARHKWESFVKQVQEQCPRISDDDLIRVSRILASLEQSSSQYALLKDLHDLDPTQLDDLHKLLSSWSLDMVKVVLDEVESRLKLIDEMIGKTSQQGISELQELQPLFERGLWIFGPEFETIEYTSNKGMTTLIQTLFQSKTAGSRNRPDFAVLPDGTVGLYSYPRYDDDGGEVGVDRLFILELKSPGIEISSEEIEQCWKYVKELYEKGLLDAASRVTCFVLGDRVDPQETSPTEKKGGSVKIRPITYQLALDRAKSRLLKLYEKVKDVPFLNEEGEEQDEDNDSQGELALSGMP